MKNASVLSLSITFVLMIFVSSTICDEQAELQSMKQETALIIMDNARDDLIIGQINVDQAVKIITNQIHDYILIAHPVRKVMSSDEVKDKARQMIILFTEQRDMGKQEYRAARYYLSAEEQAQLDVRYNAFETKLNELIYEQKIITGEAMSGLKKILLGAAAVGVVLLVGRYMFSMNPVEQKASAQRVPEVEQQIPQTDIAPTASSIDAEIERDALMKQITDAKAQLEAEKEYSTLRSAGQNMIDRKREERGIEKDIENMEWQYKENIAREQQQLRKQAWFDVAASYALTGISLLLGTDMPLVGGSILVPLQPFGYMAHPVAMLARTAAVTGAMGVYRFIQSLPEDRPVPRIFEHINPH
jgi:hypothetical protein